MYGFLQYTLKLLNNLSERLATHLRYYVFLTCLLIYLMKTSLNLHVISTAAQQENSKQALGV